jgi:hypothetical protein
MSEDNNPWYQLGFAVERARRPLTGSSESVGVLESLRKRLTLAAREAGGVPEPDNPATGRRLALLGERKGGKNGKGKRGAGGDDFGLGSEALIVAGAATLGAELLKRWPGRRRVNLFHYVRGGAAGAAAALAVEVLRPLLSGQDSADPSELSEKALAGVGLGLVYAAALEPRIPGTPLIRGALMGVVSYILSPLGGITRVLRPLSPHRKVPILSGLLEQDDPDDRTFAEAVTLGVILGLLYESGESSGIEFDDE